MRSYFVKYEGGVEVSGEDMFQCYDLGGNAKVLVVPTMSGEQIWAKNDLPFHLSLRHPYVAELGIFLKK